MAERRISQENLQAVGLEVPEAIPNRQALTNFIVEILNTNWFQEKMEQPDLAAKIIEFQDSIVGFEIPEIPIEDEWERSRMAQKSRGETPTAQEKLDAVHKKVYAVTFQNKRTAARVTAGTLAAKAVWIVIGDPGRSNSKGKRAQRAAEYAQEAAQWIVVEDTMAAEGFNVNPYRILLELVQKGADIKPILSKPAKTPAIS